MFLAPPFLSPWPESRASWTHASDWQRGTIRELAWRGRFLAGAEAPRGKATVRNHSQTSAGHFREAATSPLALLKDPPPTPCREAREECPSQSQSRHGARGMSPEISECLCQLIDLPAATLTLRIPVSIPGSENSPSPTIGQCFHRIREQGAGSICTARLSSSLHQCWAVGQRQMEDWTPVP